MLEFPARTSLSGRNEFDERGEGIMIGVQWNSAFAAGLTALALAVLAPRARGDVVTLGDLLSGASIRGSGLSYENFRNFSGPTYPHLGTAVDPNNVIVSTTPTGLEFTGANGRPLAPTGGQVPTGAMFTFDVRALGAGPDSIGQARLEMTGEVAFLGLQEPALSAILTSTGTTPPFQLYDQSDQSTGSNPVVNSTTFQGVSLLTVTVQFDAIGITSHGTNTFAAIDQVGVSFVPEPGFPLLVGTMAVLGLMSRRWRRPARRLDTTPH
jgi:hypothetical protein